MKALLFVLSLSLSFGGSMAQGAWNSKKCAVVLTYDDALNVHLDKAIPLLDSLGLKGTFYLSAFFPGCKERISDWRAAAAAGHELGNHTMFHPCTGKNPGREWVSAERDLNNYTMARMLDEIRMTNVFLQAIDGNVRRSFAYPCGDTLVQGKSFAAQIRNDFVSARGVQARLTPMRPTNLFMIGSHMINGQTGAQMIQLVKEAMKVNSMLVFLFHGVGGEHGLNVSLKDHRELLKFLKENEKDIWVAPFIEVTEYLHKQPKL
jgi:peptidoglycan-N-acetylglucosamine deacetylase